MLDERFDLTHFFVPRHEALVEEPAEPLQVAAPPMVRSVAISALTWSTVPARPYLTLRIRSTVHSAGGSGV